MLDTVSPNRSRPSNIRTLLIIEDNPSDIIYYERLLETFSHGFDDIKSARTLSQAKELMTAAPPSCCLLDNHLPDGNAKNLLDFIQPNSICPIIIITGQESTSTAVNLMHSGAQDYLVKQHLDSSQLERAILNAVSSWNLQNEINYLALYDSLTGLANRPLFIDRISNMFSDSQRYDSPFALIYLDLDRFKSINDSHGHEAGDAVLKEVGERILSLLRTSDTAARLGGDEFAVLLPNTTKEKANYVAYRLVRSLTFQMAWRGHSITTSPSIGLTTRPSKAQSYEQMMREADLALYRSKQGGRARYSSFSKHFENEILERERLLSEIPRAILDNHLQLAWQPIIRLSDHTICSIEALVRWNHGNQWLDPHRIIDLILDCRLGDEYHEWLFNNALHQLSIWKKENQKLKIAINLPANLCHDKNIFQSLHRATNTYSIAPQDVVVEITETHFISHPEETREQLLILSSYGFEISIDDFGTGYSSMKYLASLPCNSLKIDKDFFLNMKENPRNNQIIEAVTALAHRLDLKVIAEGIETNDLLEYALDFGCDFAQGFWLGSPIIASGSFSEFCKESLCKGRD